MSNAFIPRPPATQSCHRPDPAMRSTMPSMARCNPAATGAAASQEFVAVLQTEPRIKLLAAAFGSVDLCRRSYGQCTADSLAPRISSNSGNACSIGGQSQPPRARLTGIETQQLRTPAIEIAQRVRILEVLFQVQSDFRSPPARGGSKFPIPVQRQHGGIIEGRRIVRRCRMRRVMLHHHHLRVGKPRPQRQMNLLREWANQGDADSHSAGRAA